QLAGTLSGGQKQRLALAAPVLHKPELLLLDEPTSAVDPESRRDFWAGLFELADAGTTLLVSTHYMDEAERCHHLAILERGRLVADGTPQALCAALPGSTWLITSTRARPVEAALHGKPGILGTAQIGTALRVLAEPGMDEAALRAMLPADSDARIAPVAPNLEDVFVAATRAARQKAGASGTR
ncbi:MAG: ABC transporter ATP-binding protein, partial [Arenimonas sp.]